MPRLHQLTLENAGRSRDALAGIAARQGRVTAMVATMAHSPAVLEGYRLFQRSLKKSELSAELREVVALAVAEFNGCAYCLAAHTASARQLGLSETAIDDAREGRADDPADSAALEFALQVARRPADVTDADIERLRAATFTDAEIAQLIAAVALNQFTNAFNIVAGVEPEHEATARPGRAA